ncbi:hypothetical protein MASR2M48_10010 [Spirochaetota bacterium]
MDLVIDDTTRLILDSLYDGILIIDHNGLVVYVNPAYSRITLMSAQDIIGRLLSEARPGSHLTQVMKTGHMELAVRRKLGFSEYMVNMVPIIVDGETLGGISLVNDISDVYRLLEDLDQSNRLIKRLSERVRRMGKTCYTFEDIVFGDPKTEHLIALSKRVASKNINVLISGDSGTGKELYAQSIHNASERKYQPFLAVNCAAFEPSLLDSELFGYEEGSFTGAMKGGKHGLFEEANGGTLFLDELSELDYRLQAKLLRALQENLIRPVGGMSEIAVDVRIIAATNKDLEIMIDHKLFRRDLYYRVAGFGIHLPPLKERKADINPLVRKFLEENNSRDKTETSMDDQTMNALREYDWPGNVRELRNTIAYASMMSDNGQIRERDLPPKMRQTPAFMSYADERKLADIVREVEEKAIRAAVEHYGHNVEGKRKAAESLGISLATLYNKLA